MAYTAIIKESQFQPGDVVGDYAILRCLRNGLTGGLYHARDGRDKKTCLIQVLPEALTRDPSPFEAIRAASAKLAKAKAKSLLAPDVVEMSGGHLVLRHPDVDGITLAEYMSKGGNDDGLPEEEVAFFLEGVSGAVGAANRTGVPHLALSPEDIIVAKTGEVKVLGFGIFGALHRRRFEMFISTAIIPLANPEAGDAFTPVDAISPELRNGGEGGEPSDVYALGLIGHYLFTGRRESRDDWRLTERRDDIAGGWEVLLRAATESNPVDRYASVEAFRRDLQGVGELEQAAVGKNGASADAAVFSRGGDGKVKRSPGAGREKSWRRPALMVAALAAVAALAVTQVLPWLRSPAPPPDLDTVLAPSPAEANVVLRVSPPAGSGRVHTVRAAPFSFSGGQAALLLPRGTHRIRVDAPGFAPATTDLVVGAEPVRAELALSPEWGSLRVEGTPGTKLFSVGGGSEVFIAPVPPEGELVLNDRLLAVEHDLELRLEGYLPLRHEAVRLRADRLTEVSGFLEDAPGALSILADYEGVPVEVDGALRGRTPLKVRGLAVNRPLTVRVGGGEWRVVERGVTLERGEAKVLHFGSLEAASGQLIVRLETGGGLPREELLGGLRVRLGGEEIKGRAEFRREVPAGKGILQVEHPDFRPLSLPFSIHDGEEKQLVAELHARPARLRVLGDFPRGEDARLVVDGEARTGVPDPVEIPTGRKVRVTLVVRDHEPVSQTFDLAPNEEKTWTPRMERLPGPSRGEAWSVPYLAYDFVWIPPGTATMGSPVAEHGRLPTEGPLTTVVFREGFWMAVCETTQVLFEHLTGDNPSRFPGARHPVDNVTWSAAMEFCRLLNERERAAGRLPEGYAYRLPTEAEWEYAARAGARTAFHWGDTADASRGNFKGRYPRETRGGVTGIARDENYGTVEVGSYAPNAFGLHDMHGNVREWTMDYFIDRLPGGRVEPFVRRSGLRGRVVRGGGWEDFAFRARAAARERASADIPNHATGFRVVLAPLLE